jgi:toxoflavin biosynthesis protein ToxC
VARGIVLLRAIPYRTPMPTVPPYGGAEMIEHTSPISGVDAHGTMVATAGYDNRVILWDGTSRAALAEGRHDHLANQCRFARSGRLLATSGSDYSARLWSVPDLRLVTVLTDQKDDVETTAISPDESRVVTTSRDHLVRLYDLDGRLLHRMEGHEADVLSAEWTDGGRRIVTTSDDGTVRWWDAERGALVQTLDLGDVETDTIAVIDDDFVVLGNDKGELVAARTGHEPVFHAAHDAGIKRLAYDPVDDIVVSCSYDRTVRFWRFFPDGTVSHLHTTDVPADVWMRSCARLGDGQWVFGTFGTSYAVYDRSRDAWDLGGVRPTPGVNSVTVHDGQTFTVGDSGAVRRGGEVVAELGSCCNVIFPFAGRMLAGGQLGTLFDATTGARLYQHRSPINCMASYTGPDGPELVAGTYTGEGVRLVAGADGGLAWRGNVRLHDNAIKGVAVANGVLFSVCATGAAAFHRLPDFELVAEVPQAHDRIANGAAALPDGRFASVGRDLMLRLWAPDGRRLAAVGTPHRNSIKCVAVDPRTSLVATGGYHGRVAVYDPDARRWVADVRPTTAGISSLCPGDAPGRFLASSYDGSIYPVTVAR